MHRIAFSWTTIRWTRALPALIAILAAAPRSSQAMEPEFGFMYELWASANTANEWFICETGELVMGNSAFGNVAVIGPENPLYEAALTQLESHPWAVNVGGEAAEAASVGFGAVIGWAAFIGASGYLVYESAEYYYYTDQLVNDVGSEPANNLTDYENPANYLIQAGQFWGDFFSYVGDCLPAID